MIERYKAVFRRKSMRRVSVQLKKQAEISLLFVFSRYNEDVRSAHE